LFKLEKNGVKIMNTKKSLFVGIGAGIIILAIFAGCVTNTTPSKPVSPGSPPPEILQYATDWPLANHDYANTREITTSGINSGNVHQLTEAWMFTINASGAFGALPTIPLILGNMVYFHDINANAYAVYLNNGTTKWMKIYNSTGLEGPFGVAVGYGKLFMQKDNFEIIALNLSNGNELWSKKINDVNTTGIDIQPQIYDGMLYTSTVPGTGDIFYAGGGMGMLYALDVNNGSIRWSFNTIKDGDLWGHPEVNSGGGAWYTPSIDTKTGFMFWGIGNPAPFPGTSAYPNGASYGYNTLYTDCSLALNHTNGDLIWYQQVLQHDIQDHDLQIAEILVNNVTASGKTHDVVIASGKMGKVYSIDRATGNLLWAVPVGEHTPNDQWDQFPTTTNTSDFELVGPSVIGGVETPMAYSDGIIYVPVEDLMNSWNSTTLDFSSLNFTSGKGELVALDVRSGNTIWAQYFNPGVNVGGATVVNDLVFTATFNGMIYAFNKKTGEKLFEYQAPGGINGQPAVAGNTIIFPISISANPGLLALRIG
jgi:outer membrane protein assembly factor BamB